MIMVDNLFDNFIVTQLNNVIKNICYVSEFGYTNESKQIPDTVGLFTGVG